MNTQTPTRSSAGMSAQEVYDSFMAVIEPELLTANLKTLDEGYDWETPDDRKARYSRYDYAFMLLHEAMEDWATILRTNHIELSAIAESFSTEDDDNRLQSIDDSLNAA